MAVPPSVKLTTVSVALTAVCVTVNVALIGPGSEPFSVPATETVALSLSVMFRLAVGGRIGIQLMPALPLVIGVRVTATVSVGSTTASLITGMVIVAVVLPAGIVTECVMAV